MRETGDESEIFGNLNDVAERNRIKNKRSEAIKKGNGKKIEISSEFLGHVAPEKRIQAERRPVDVGMLKMLTRSQDPKKNPSTQLSERVQYERLIRETEKATVTAH